MRGNRQKRKTRGESPLLQLLGRGMSGRGGCLRHVQKWGQVRLLPPVQHQVHVPNKR